MKNHLYEYLKINRGVGHTRLILDGARNAHYPFLVVGADMTHANRLARDLGNEFAIPTIISNEIAFRGHEHPVLIDNYTFTNTCEMYMRELRDAREARITAEEKLALNQAGIKKLEVLPFWIRLFTPLYKRAIKRNTL